MDLPAQAGAEEVVTGHVGVHLPRLRTPKENMHETETQLEVESKKVAISHGTVCLALVRPIRVLDEHIEGIDHGGLNNLPGQLQDHVSLHGGKAPQVFHPNTHPRLESDPVAHDFRVRGRGRHRFGAEFDQRGTWRLNPEMLGENVANELETQRGFNDFGMTDRLHQKRPFPSRLVRGRKTRAVDLHGAGFPTFVDRNKRISLPNFEIKQNTTPFPCLSAARPVLPQWRHYNGVGLPTPRGPRDIIRAA